MTTVSWRVSESGAAGISGSQLNIIQHLLAVIIQQVLLFIKH